MNYETAKANFEAVVNQMQEDLKADATNPRVSAKMLEYRLWVVNALVEFYQLAEEQISVDQLQYDEAYFNYQRLHGDAQRLVVFAELHGVYPDMIFHYSIEELKQMQADGVQFRPPLKSFDRIFFVQENGKLDLRYREIDMDEEDKISKYSDKYYNLKAKAERC